MSISFLEIDLKTKETPILPNLKKDTTYTYIFSVFLLDFS